MENFEEIKEYIKHMEYLCDYGFIVDEKPIVSRYVKRYARPSKKEKPLVGRNDPCPCGSGKKYKKCCLV